ncbi:hypothetical protein HMPREF9124_1770 [Oribacterium sp. oral taxon 108 str. F0425]|nr:hypothetical protein HMPREF9124_1770 [Oribacterium sp. oral taxon 108 str. F0425]
MYLLFCANAFCKFPEKNEISHALRTILVMNKKDNCRK